MTTLEEKMNDDRQSLEAEGVRERAEAEKALAQTLRRTLLHRTMGDQESDRAARDASDAATPAAPNLDEVVPLADTEPTLPAVPAKKKKRKKGAGSPPRA